MSLYQRIAEKLQYISPAFYKKRFFKNISQLSRNNFSVRNVEPELVWIKEYLSADAVIFDIGANVGTFLYQLEDHLQHENIFGFEPNEALHKRLMRLFPNMRIFPVALSDENTTATFKVPVINGQKVASRGTLNTSYKEKGEEKSHTENVTVVKLDYWTAQLPIQRLDFIKIDVEGNEMKTLAGARNTIARFSPTLMVEMEQRHHDTPVWDEIALIESWGYEACYLDRDTFTLKKLTQTILHDNSDDEKNKKEYINNIIFTPKSQ
ncbi:MULTISPECIES: FkbM family methyltransferase [Chryseobacterium]|uniref:FkbM family methyltransferase n=1 Tax=Chryseobacterium camelliae TaxID=1265445 RepID=A0ABU0TLK9_9FLAO|nr:MULTISPECIES: FkbM family methyltransferase [Chryseobacterium]MDT3408983.1 FkbM family methyltransferase [Pseudacidovorax intermedius]MDQ1097160.1 FkbM family methyltransferase [Chryseobacterium camelliae]MDQ1101097.1 FkbM family methyltransferase [Chryseobacterium sp. SORGH_AS_1048]MDR6084540.1 FkbM family methyltransferase [Chryseobacterium sp. SORGH_AS_0909]MDR6132809.1 FkbM family methyltransferase [Chryseobacterium sp. SORGH_AS_1175]